MRSLSEIALTTRLTLFADREAFSQLVSKHQSALRRFFLHLTLGDQMLSDDLAQDTFIKAWTHIDQYSAKSTFQTWLFGIGYNTWYDHLRSRHLTDDIDEAFDIGYEQRDTALHLDMVKALSQLKPIERTCVTLQVIEDQKIEDIAKITQLNANTVKSHIARGKQKLAEYLKHNGYEQRSR
ncbi:MAG: RNA polymerase sigma factor [Bacteroidales bacterium]|nr:RNA polymerase sigma factor [Candidatus Liminaster caballi]